VTFDKSIRKSVQPFLEGAEQLLGAVMAQNAGANAAAMVSALRGPLATTKAYDRADQRHADAVDAAGLSKAVTLRVRGSAIGIETARGQPAEDLPRALELARVA
jgi:hypothetical protein